MPNNCSIKFPYTLGLIEFDLFGAWVWWWCWGGGGGGGGAGAECGVGVGVGGGGGGTQYILLV